jgi:ParB family protein of integrating conjugative element (PFGI_1 class)
MSRARKALSVVGEAPAAFVLALDEIVPFDKDPRQAPNSEYPRIKDSVRAQGIDQPLVVTRRPGAAHYVIAAGGNTRLKILRELFQETNEPRFAHVTCVYKPWRGEADIVLAHLRENDLRGGLIFLDKARAVREARQLIETEEGTIGLTLTDLTEILRDRGYALSRTSLSHMDYVVDVLDARLPLALRGGLAHREVIKVRALERAASALWADRVPAGNESFDEIFTVLCRRYDGPDWDLLSLRQAIEAEIADRLNQTVHAIRLALDARLSGVVETALPCRDEDDEWWPEPVERKPRSPIERPAAASQNLQPTAADDGARGSQTANGQGDEGGGPLLSQMTPSGTFAGFEPFEQSPTQTISELRVQAAGFASALASHHGLADLIIPTPETGTGFLLADVLAPELIEQLDEAGLGQVSMIWWQLAACAEMTVAPVACLLPHLDATSVLYRALRDADATLLFGAVWTVDPGQVGFRLWRTLSEQDWSDLLSLMSCYRSLHRLAAATNTPLWSTES